MNKLRKLKFNDVSVLLVFCIVVLMVGIVLLVNRSIRDEQVARANLPIRQLQSELDKQQDFITAPVTPEQYLEITKGSVPPSGYLLRLWDSKEENAARLEAIEDYPKPYPTEGD